MDLPARPPYGISPRKASLLADCPRKLGWLLHSWGGWLPDAEELTRRAYLLGKLEASLASVVGSATHELATSFALAARAGKNLPTREEAQQFLEGRIQRVVGAKSFERFARSPKRNPLLASTWSFSDPTPEEIEAAHDKARRISANMAASEVWDSVAYLRADEGWNLYLEQFFTVQLDGADVLVRVDFAAEREIFHDMWIWDHKTPQEGLARGRDEIIDQLGTYAWVLGTHFGVEFPTLWRVSAIDWVAGETMEVSVTEEMLATVRGRLRKGLEEIRRYHDPETHIPAPITMFEAPPDHQRWMCARCPYLELCVDVFGMRPYA